MIPVVLSGGSGTRLWPLSRSKTPKQLCNFFDKTLQEMTLRRLMPLSTPWVVTNTTLKDQTELQFRRIGLPSNHILLEPVAKNTAPAIALVCKVMELQGKTTEIVGIFPADHLIEDEVAFLETLKIAEAEAKNKKIVTLGITPDHPATGYGYIETQGKGVLRFCEKPDLATAQKFVASGNYFWNAGIFIFQVSTMIELLKKHQGENWQIMSALKPDLSNLKDVYGKLQSISIDYGILEKLDSTHLSCIPCEAGWNDIGSWDAIADILTNKESDVLEVECKGNFVHTHDGKLYAFAGVSDLIVVDTKDALLITKKGQSQTVKNVVDALKERKGLLLHQQVDEERPWGGFEVFKDEPTFKTKLIVVNPGQQISYQSHSKREEHWLVVEGSGEIILNDQVIPVARGVYTKIPLQAKHRIRNNGKVDLKFVEVQIGSYFGEDDIVRYQDDYQRS